MPESSLKPKYRFALRAKIHEAGYRTLTEFSQAVGTNLPLVSKICSGWELPSVPLSRKMAKKLGITLREFERIL